MFHSICSFVHFSIVLKDSFLLNYIVKKKLWNFENDVNKAPDVLLPTYVPTNVSTNCVTIFAYQNIVKSSRKFEWVFSRCLSGVKSPFFLIPPQGGNHPILGLCVTLPGALLWNLLFSFLEIQNWKKCLQTTKKNIN